MFHEIGIIRSWRSAALGFVAAAGMLVTGCAQDESSPQWSTTGSSGTAGALATSNTGSAAQSSKQQSDRIQVSRAFPTGNRNTSDLLVEQIGPREVRVGRPYTYQLKVTNLTNQPLTGVVLRQHVSDNFKLSQNDAVKASQENGQEAQIQIGDLGPKQTKTVELTGTPSQPGTLDTCLSAQYNPPTLCAQVAIVAPAIKAIAQGPSQADICQDLDYRYTVTNTGTGTAHNVVLREDLPEGMQTAEGQRTLSMNIGDLGQGQSKDVTAHLKANKPGRFETRATVSSDVGDVQTEQVATNVLAPRLAVTVTGPNEIVMDQPVRYQITVKNNGDAAAANTRLRVGATPGSIQFVSAEGGEGAQLASERPGTGQDLGTIPPGESRTVAINFKPQRGGAVAFDATAQSNCAQPVTTSVNTSVKTLTASALVVTHDPDPVPVGSVVTYHITVQNKGSAADRDVRVTAILPDSEQYVRAGGKSSASNEGQTITFAPIAVIEPKQSISWDVQAKAMRPDQAQFKATMTTQSTPNTAVKLEPTKLFAGQGGTQTHTNEAQPQQPVNESAPQQPAAPNKQ